MDADVKQNLIEYLQQAEYALFEARNILSGYDTCGAEHIGLLHDFVEGALKNYSNK